MVPGGPNFNTHLRPLLTKGSRSQKLKGSACKSRELCVVEEIPWLKLLVLGSYTHHVCCSRMALPARLNLLEQAPRHACPSQLPRGPAAAFIHHILFHSWRTSGASSGRTSDLLSIRMSPVCLQKTALPAHGLCREQGQLGNLLQKHMAAPK